MDAEDLIIDHHAKCKVVEHVGEVVPDISVAVLAGTLGIESIGLGYAAGLVVAADKVNSVGVAKLKTDEERDRLHAE